MPSFHSPLLWPIANSSPAPPPAASREAEALLARRPGKGNAMRVELLYFDGCPGHAALLPRLRELVGETAAIELRRVESPEEAHAERFLGSPTLRIDGEDVEPGAGERSDYGVKCRLYRSAEGQSHAPPDDWIRRALRAAEGHGADERPPGPRRQAS